MAVTLMEMLRGLLTMCYEYFWLSAQQPFYYILIKVSLVTLLYSRTDICSLG